MAAKTLNDSAGWASLHVKEVQVAAAGTAQASVPKVGDFFVKGAKHGFIIDNPRQGEDTAWYATVDLAARVRFDGFSGAATDGATVYITSGGAPTLTASGNTRIGYVDMPSDKPTGTGKLIVQLTPQSA
jgi:hypothetical protein